MLQLNCQKGKWIRIGQVLIEVHSLRRNAVTLRFDNPEQLEIQLLKEMPATVAKAE